MARGGRTNKAKNARERRKQRQAAIAAKSQAVIKLVKELLADRTNAGGTLALAATRPAQQPGEEPNMLDIYAINEEGEIQRNSDSSTGLAALHNMASSSTNARFMTLFDRNGVAVATFGLSDGDGKQQQQVTVLASTKPSIKATEPQRKEVESFPARIYAWIRNNWKVLAIGGTASVAVALLLWTWISK